MADTSDLIYALDQLINNPNISQDQRRTYLQLMATNTTYIVRAIGEANLSDQEIADLYIVFLTNGYDSRFTIYSYFNKPSIRSMVLNSIINLKGARLSFIQNDYPTPQERSLIIDSIYRDQDKKSAETLLNPRSDKHKYTIPEQHLKDKLEALTTMDKFDQFNKLNPKAKKIDDDDWFKLDI